MIYIGRIVKRKTDQCPERTWRRKNRITKWKLSKN